MWRACCAPRHDRPVRAMTAPASRRASVKPAPKHRKRAKPDPVKTWARRLARYRPNLQRDVLDGLASAFGHPVWERRLDPTSELILTILTQNSADTNAEKAFEALCLARSEERRVGKERRSRWSADH